MIGDKNTKDIALGYEVRKYSELTPEEKKIIPDRLSKALDDFATAAKAAIKALKEGSSALKANLEKTKDDLRAQPTTTDEAFHEYLFGQGSWKGAGYIEQLRKIGVTSGMIFDDVSLKSAVSALNVAIAKPDSTVKAESPTTPVVVSPTTPVVVSPTTVTPEAKSYAFSAEVDATKLQVVVKTKVTGATEVVPPIPLLTVFTDSTSAYQEVNGAATVRPVFIKKGKSDYKGDDETQYVQDDAGIFTRRYAVMHKPKDVMEALLNPNGIVKGKLQHALGVTNRGGTDPLASDPEIYKVQKLEKGRIVGKKAGDALSTREMLHVHQELGSGDSGRGLCLTSISLTETQSTGSDWKAKLKSMYANDGIAFKSPGKTVLVLVDMARVPTGKDLLYNLYRPDAQAQAKNVKLRQGPIVFNNNKHMLNSVTKNRELFLRVLLQGYIVNWPEIEAELNPPKVTAATVSPGVGTIVT